MGRLSIDEVIEHCNRQTRDYERLNGKTELENADISLNFIKQYWEHRQVAEWLRELKTYKDAEEQGLLLKLPCKVGDTVYRIDTDERLRSVEIENHTIENIVISNWGDILFKYDAYDGVICALENITKGTLYLDFYRVFLTKEEAEQALKQMGE